MGVATKDTTGISLINPSAHFQPLNCQWKKKKDPKEIIEKIKPPVIDRGSCRTMSITLGIDHIEWIKKQARAESVKRKYHVSVNRLISELIEKHLPYPKTIDMLGGKI